VYIPEYYRNENREEIEAFLRSNSFGILVSQNDGRLFATHIPLELDVNAAGKNILHGHISKENEQWKSFDRQQVLAIFSGAHAYVSSSWYDFEGVPTWNYTAVHVSGKLRIVSEAELLSSLKKLVDKYEANSENPVQIENLSKQTMMMTRAIVGFEIEISDIQATKKMSQNRDDKNYNNVISELEKTGNTDALDVAAEMKKCPR
jgi:transcriptional regulator